MEFFDAISGLTSSSVAVAVVMFCVFARMSIFIFLMPGVGEISVPVRFRLLTALMLSWLVAPTLQSIPIEMPMGWGGMFKLLIQQIFYGFVLGFSVRAFIYGLQISGSIISQSMSLSQIFGEGITTEPNTTLSTLFMLGGITLALTWDLHIHALGVFISSFEVFPIGIPLESGRTALWATRTFADVFAFSVTLAAPFVLLNFVYNLILGFVNRAMPQLMVSFVGMPAITGTGIYLLVISSGTILLVWLAQYRDHLAGMLL